MFSWIKYFEFLGEPEFSNDFVESFTSFISCSTEIIVFRGERRVKYENCVRCSFTNCYFRYIKVNSGVLFESYVFFFILQTLWRTLRNDRFVEMVF